MFIVRCHDKLKGANSIIISAPNQTRPIKYSLNKLLVFSGVTGGTGLPLLPSGVKAHHKWPRNLRTHLKTIEDNKTMDLPLVVGLAIGMRDILRLNKQFLEVGVCNNSSGTVVGIALHPDEPYLLQRSSNQTRLPSSVVLKQQPAYVLVHILDAEKPWGAIVCSQGARRHNPQCPGRFTRCSRSRTGSSYQLRRAVSWHGSQFAQVTLSAPL